MNRIDRIFADLHAADGKALMPYITAGDPDLDATADILTAAQRAGAAICELGLPFSDPIADGPVIQASMAHALDHGVRPRQTLEMLRKIRPTLSIGIVAMVSWSIPYRLGFDAFLADAKDAGVDGFIFPDLPVQESADVAATVADAGLTCSLLIAPTTPIERAQQIARMCSGFVYLLSRAGLTGERSELPPELPERVQRLREVTDLPIAVGFGVASPEQVRQVVQVADAAIVGSAIMRRVAAARHLPRAQLVSQVEQFITELAAGLEGSESRSASPNPGGR